MKFFFCKFSNFVGLPFVLLGALHWCKITRDVTGGIHTPGEIESAWTKLLANQRIYSSLYGSLGKERMEVAEAIYKLKCFIFCQQKNTGKMARAQKIHREFGIVVYSVLEVRARSRKHTMLTVLIPVTRNGCQNPSPRSMFSHGLQGRNHRCGTLLDHCHYIWTFRQFLVAPASVKQSDLSSHYGVCLLVCLLVCLQTEFYFRY